jgi:nucleotide-binding universal stress UspA family protein
VDVAAGLLAPRTAVILDVAPPLTRGQAFAASVSVIPTHQFGELNAADALERARKGAARAQEAGFSAHSRSVLAAPTWEGIVDIAAELDAAVIAMGSRGFGGMREFVRGSVSHQVAEHARRPVLIVPPSRGDAAHAPTGPILLCYDGSRGARRAIRAAAALLRDREARRSGRRAAPGRRGISRRGGSRAVRHANRRPGRPHPGRGRRRSRAPGRFQAGRTRWFGGSAFDDGGCGCGRDRRSRHRHGLTRIYRHARGVGGERLPRRCDACAPARAGRPADRRSTRTCTRRTRRSPRRRLRPRREPRRRGCPGADQLDRVDPRRPLGRLELGAAHRGGWAAALTLVPGERGSSRPPRHPERLREPKCRLCRPFADGADGTRTRGLLAASQTLSQLSYGP